MSGELRAIETIFEGNRTLILLGERDAFVGMRSVVSGMGLSWGSQREKFCRDPRTVVMDFFLKSLKQKAIFFHKNFMPDFLETINPLKVPPGKRPVVQKYKELFPDFVNDIAMTENEFDIYDTYINVDDRGNVDRDGIQKLVNDVIRIHYKKGVDRITEIIYQLMSRKDLNEGQLLLSNEIHEIADYLSKNQHKLKGAA